MQFVKTLASWMVDYVRSIKIHQVFGKFFLFLIALALTVFSYFIAALLVGSQSVAIVDIGERTIEDKATKFKIISTREFMGQNSHKLMIFREDVFFAKLVVANIKGAEIHTQCNLENAISGSMIEFTYMGVYAISNDSDFSDFATQKSRCFYINTVFSGRIPFTRQVKTDIGHGFYEPFSADALERLVSRSETDEESARTDITQDSIDELDIRLLSKVISTLVGEITEGQPTYAFERRTLGEIQFFTTWLFFFALLLALRSMVLQTNDDFGDRIDALILLVGFSGTLIGLSGGLRLLGDINLIHLPTKALDLASINQSFYVAIDTTIFALALTLLYSLLVVMFMKKNE